MELASLAHEFIELAVQVARRPSRGFGNLRAKDVVESANLDVALVLVVREADPIALAWLGLEIKKN